MIAMAKIYAIDICHAVLSFQANDQRTISKKLDTG